MSSGQIVTQMQPKSGYSNRVCLNAEASVMNGSVGFVGGGRRRERYVLTTHRAPEVADGLEPGVMRWPFNVGRSNANLATAIVCGGYSQEVGGC